MVSSFFFFLIQEILKQAWEMVQEQSSGINAKAPDLQRSSTWCAKRQKKCRVAMEIMANCLKCRVAMEMRACPLNCRVTAKVCVYESCWQFCNFQVARSQMHDCYGDLLVQNCQRWFKEGKIHRQPGQNMTCINIWPCRWCYGWGARRPCTILHGYRGSLPKLQWLVTLLHWQGPFSFFFMITALHFKQVAWLTIRLGRVRYIQIADYNWLPWLHGHRVWLSNAVKASHPCYKLVIMVTRITTSSLCYTLRSKWVKQLHIKMWHFKSWHSFHSLSVILFCFSMYISLLFFFFCKSTLILFFFRKPWQKVEEVHLKLSIFCALLTADVKNLSRNWWLNAWKRCMQQVRNTTRHSGCYSSVLLHNNSQFSMLTDITCITWRKPSSKFATHISDSQHHILGHSTTEMFTFHLTLVVHNYKSFWIEIFLAQFSCHFFSYFFLSPDYNTLQQSHADLTWRVFHGSTPRTAMLLYLCRFPYFKVLACNLSTSLH